MREIENRFKYEVMTKRLAIVIETELNVFIKDNFPCIKQMDSYFYDTDVDAGNSTLKLNFAEGFREEMLKHYPEEFV